jgi:hypothetical protein
MKRPVIWVMSALAGLNAILGLGTLQDLISPAALAWVVLVSAGVQAAVQFWVQAQVTPIALPRAADGTPLVKLGSYGTSPNSP